jgi:uncharacterized protein (TIGR03086 family)
MTPPMTETSPGPAARHRAHAATFTGLVDGTKDWGAPAPVAGWAARDVVDHLVTWLPGFLAGDGVVLPQGPSVDDDPVAAWHHHAEAVQAALDDPATAERSFVNRHVGELPLADAIDRFYTTDVFMHAWDLARASGQPVALDEHECAAMLEGMLPLDDLLRSSGQYGPRVPVPDDASAMDRLVGFIGRDPAWRPGR